MGSLIVLIIILALAAYLTRGKNKGSDLSGITVDGISLGGLAQESDLVKVLPLDEVQNSLDQRDRTHTLALLDNGRVSRLYSRDEARIMVNGQEIETVFDLYHTLGRNHTLKNNLEEYPQRSYLYTDHRYGTTALFTYSELDQKVLRVELRVLTD